jgi:hypothetical protein
LETRVGIEGRRSGVLFEIIGNAPCHRPIATFSPAFQVCRQLPQDTPWAKGCFHGWSQRRAMMRPCSPRSSRVPVAAEEPPNPERELFFGGEISGKETRDDTDDFLGRATSPTWPRSPMRRELLTASQPSLTAWTKGGDEACNPCWLAILVSQQLEPLWPQSSYASAVMLAGISKEEQLGWPCRPQPHHALAVACFCRSRSSSYAGDHHGCVGA